MAEAFLAHSKKRSPHEDLLRDHLRKVALRAGDYAAAFGAEEEAYLCGLLHDLGKYGDLFQAYLRGGPGHLDHWSLGAWAALNHSRAKSMATAMAVAGHHVGLQQADPKALHALDPRGLAAEHPLGLTPTAPDHEQLLARLATDGVALPAPLAQSLLPPHSAAAAAMLDIRMLFSALVDADFLETEAHFEATGSDAPAYRQAGPVLDASAALAAVLRHVKTLSAGSRASEKVDSLRADLLAACLKAAEQPRGAFTLTAPTGSGKTLSMLAFALQHAATHGLRRVVMVIPYLSIIEQTVQVFRKALAALVPAEQMGTYILEDHSLAGTRPTGDEEKDADADNERRLLAENWDAPIVVTTSVQFLESLFANRPAACRKLHRLAQSVILLDEVQTLPKHLAVPTLATLSRLSDHFGSSVVFATATQPAFSSLDTAVRGLCTAGWKPQEIAPPSLELFARARRVQVHWPQDEPVAWEALADELCEHEQALCIVNLKRHGLALHRALRDRGAEGLYHLSTNLCPAHRRRVLEQVTAALADGRPCRLVSTQCVEAGVDVDFPAVYRARGPLDAIAQAAGRCNRNGRRALGDVRVFVPQDEGYPDGAYRQAADVTTSLLHRRKDGADINDPALFDEYYRDLYDLAKVGEGETELMDYIRTRHFAKVAELYRIIKQDAINVLVPHAPETFAELADEVRQEGLRRDWVAKARPHAVGLYRPKPKDSAWCFLDGVKVGRRREEAATDWFIWVREEGYDKDLGLIVPETMGL